MQIHKLDFVSGAKSAKGIAVIIDVFRAFSTACYCMGRNAKSIYPVGEINRALALADKLDNTLLLGEREGEKLPGFDLGNSPTQVLNAILNNKNVIQTTHAGTQGLVNAHQADMVLTGALVNAKATAKFILKQQVKEVSLVRMGWKAESATDEDDLCADYLEALLTHKKFDSSSIEDTLRRSPCSQRFFDPKQPDSPASDFEHCIKLDTFDFALRLQKTEDGEFCLVKA